MVATSAAQINADFLSVLALIRGSIDLDELAFLIDTGRLEEAFRIVGRAAGRLGLAYQQSFVRAGAETGEWLTREVAEVVIDFDQTNVRAVRRMQENQLRLVREFTEQQRRATQQALVRGITEGLNPREQARAFRESIGLTSTQERWVANYERQLRELDRGALQRRLRDRRFDTTVRRAISNDEPLTEQQIERMVQRYRERWRKHRSETIARTESLRSVHEGVDEMYTQAVEAGELQPDQFVRIWNTARDERVRTFNTTGGATSHASMHGQERPPGVPFTSGGGNSLMFPGDSSAPGIDTINCRCSVSTRILRLSELPGGLNISVLQG